MLAYTYDADSRTTAINGTLANNPVGDLEYSYDADGHVVEKSGSMAATNLPQTVTGNTFNADNEMTAFNGTALTGACPERSRGNANGNLLNDGRNTYAWDARNHLSAITGANTASFVGACPEQSRRNPFSRRMSKTIGGNVRRLTDRCSVPSGSQSTGKTDVRSQVE